MKNFVLVLSALGAIGCGQDSPVVGENPGASNNATNEATHNMTSIATNNGPSTNNSSTANSTNNGTTSTNNSSTSASNNQSNVGTNNANPDNWDNTVTPPTLTNPTRITISNTSATANMPDFDHIGCDGKVFEIKLSPDEDAMIEMAPDSGPLIYPVWVTGGRNVHVKGLDIEPIVQAGCGIGEGNFKDKDGNRINQGANIYPRIPGGEAMRLEQKGTTFIEGARIELNQAEADVLVMRSHSNNSTSPLTDRHFVVINSYFAGYESIDDDGAPDLGDGLHGDTFQNQGATKKENPTTLVFENVSVRSAGNGITLHKWGGDFWMTKLLKLRNYDYARDSRYGNDDIYDRKDGLCFSAGVEAYDFENVWINDHRGLNYGLVSGERVGAAGQNGVTADSEVHGGDAPTPFAPEDKTGLNYRSPF